MVHFFALLLWVAGGAGVRRRACRSSASAIFVVIVAQRGVRLRPGAPRRAGAAERCATCCRRRATRRPRRPAARDRRRRAGRRRPGAAGRAATGSRPTCALERRARAVRRRVDAHRRERAGDRSAAATVCRRARSWSRARARRSSRRPAPAPGWPASPRSPSCAAAAAAPLRRRAATGSCGSSPSSRWPWASAFFGLALLLGTAASRRVPVRRRRDRRAGARGAAADRDAVAGRRRAADGAPPRPGPPARVGGDAGLDHVHLHRQDRHADPEPDGGGRGLDARRARRRIDGRGLRPRRPTCDCGRPRLRRRRCATLAVAAVRCSTGRVVERRRAMGRRRATRWRPRSTRSPAGSASGAGATRRALRRTARFPFDPRRRRMSVVTDGRVLVKGAPDAVLPRCLASPDGARPSALEELAATGPARAGGGRAGTGRAPTARRATADEAETGLELLGLVGLEDPPARRTRPRRSPPAAGPASRSR